MPHPFSICAFTWKSPWQRGCVIERHLKISTGLFGDEDEHRYNLFKRLKYWENGERETGRKVSAIYLQIRTGPRAGTESESPTWVLGTHMLEPGACQDEYQQEAGTGSEVRTQTQALHNKWWRCPKWSHRCYAQTPQLWKFVIVIISKFLSHE